VFIYAYLSFVLRRRHGIKYLTILKPGKISLILK